MTVLQFNFMSYCINCGVELDASAKKCVLCNTPVINPNIPPVPPDEDEKPFSDKLQLPKTMQKRFAAYVVSMVLLIINMVLFFVNLLTFRENGSYWSLYVISSSLLFWSVFLLPFFIKRMRPYILWGADTLVTLMYSYILFALLPEKPWMPISIYSVIGVVSAVALAFIVWTRRKKRHWTAITAHLLFDSMFVTFVCGSLVAMYSKITAFFYVGLVCSICFLALMCFFIYCNRSKHMRAWLSKAFYI